MKDLQALGYKNVPLDQLVQLQIHGVTTAMIRRLESAGYKNLSADQLVQLKIHGVARPGRWLLGFAAQRHNSAQSRLPSVAPIVTQS